MTIHLVCSGQTPELSPILYTALCRSFTRSQVASLAYAAWSDAIKNGRPLALVVANPPDHWADLLLRSLEIPGNKILLLGRIPTQLAAHFGADVSPLNGDLETAGMCLPTASSNFSESSARVRYRKALPLGASSPVHDRAFCRFDFTDEWNNLGYGAIRVDGSIWALAQLAQVSAEQSLADVLVGQHVISAYAALWECGESNLLWFNRAVGPVDSQEWRLVERYFSSYAYPKAICIPVPREIPAGFDAAVTMRLDCDEDIASAVPLFDLYRTEEIPFSLALHTTLLSDPKHFPLLKQVVESGGSILTHSATHPPAWGGSYEAALAEVRRSCQEITNALGSDIRVDYAVSPFHQNPPCSVAAMADAGLSGFIGGIIRNDPEYLFARGGEVPNGAEGFISHSQQCMLIGDCLLSEDDPIRIYKQSFDVACEGRALFGYLDHPFSARYQYGWESEAQRIAVHQALIKHIKACGEVLFLSQNNALDWLRFKASLTIQVADESKFKVCSPRKSRWKVSIEYGGNDHWVEVSPL